MKLEELVENIVIGTIVNVTYQGKCIEQTAWDWCYSEHEWLQRKVKNSIQNTGNPYHYDVVLS